ncbi:MAG: hypothetical protein NVSMB17_16470 [Candidatus Dormibacteria bacterium]
MFSRLRRSFAAKLVALEVGTILVVAMSVAALLIYDRLLQSRDFEQNVARASADGLRADLRAAGANGAKLAGSLAAFPALRDEFGNADHARMEALVNAEAQLLPKGESLVTFDARGQPILGRAGNGSQSTSDAVDAATFAGLTAVTRAAAGEVSREGRVEMGAGKLRLDAVAVVRRGGAVVGYVVDSQEVQSLLRRLSRPGSRVQFSVFHDGRREATTVAGPALPAGLPAGLGAADAGGARFGTYELGGTTYAGFYAPLQPGDRSLVVAEVDDALFATQRLNDILVVVLATTLLATVLALAGVYFARRTALRPLSALAAGARRVQAGDYTAPVRVDSEDDFGRLAVTFNEMAEQIHASTEALERQRAHLDAAITSLGSVSRALTTTTAGEAKLRQAVLDAVLEMTGADAAAMYEGRDRLRVSATRGLEVGKARTLLGLLDRGRVLEPGESVLVDLEDAPGEFKGWSALAVPMIYQGAPAGMLAAYGRRRLAGVDIPTLSVLATQAVVALQNSVLFQRERETVGRLQELDAMKSDFLATIQHELRTPLTAIMGMSDLLEMAWDVWPEEQKKEAISDVQVSAKSLYEIVETILDYSMLESRRVKLSMASYGLRQIAEGAIEELRPLIRRSDVAIDVKVPARVKVRGDAQRLNQVMKALVDNAIKFSPEKARVQVRAEQQNGKVTLRVIDRGIGIAPEHQQQIFQRFFQVDNTATRHFGGTGMGLALVKQLVELHDGRVSVESTPGKGSTFTVTLPSGS